MRFLIRHFFQSPVIPSPLDPKMLFSAIEIIDCKKTTSSPLYELNLFSAEKF